MKPSFFLLAAALLLPAAGAFAQLPTAPVAGPAAPGARPLAPASAASRPCARGMAGGGSVTYFGAVCSHDPHHEQFARLRQAFADGRPTVVFYEKPDCGTDSTETATIRRRGEAAYVRFLARQHGVRAERLDNPVAEYAYLRARIDPERLKLYCLLRDIQQLRARTSPSKALTVKLARQLLTNSAYFAPGTEQVIHNVAELEMAYRKHCPVGGKWWQAPAAWFNPNAAAIGSSNPFLADLNGTIRAFRERYMYRRLAEWARAGHRVLVVADPDHLPAPAPALARR